MNWVLRTFSFVNSKSFSKRSVVLIDEIMSRARKQTTLAGCSSYKERLVWVDCEMTGLDVDTCHLLEVACIITDDQLNILAEGPNIIIHQSDEILQSMNEWCQIQHGRSGLTEQVRQSLVSLQQAEMELVSFVRQHTPRGSCPLAGNTVHADKKFLDKYMPQFVDHLHYRIVDVSTIKELCRRWFPKEYELAPRKAASHRALEDIKESVKELQYYRQAIFKCPLF